jgi:TonB family protein
VSVVQQIGFAAVALLSTLLVAPVTGTAQQAMAVSAGEAVSRPPELLNLSEIVAALNSRYPPALMRNRISGRPVLQLEIDTTGRVKKAQVKYAGGHHLFAEAARKVASQMQFSPGMQAGRPARMTINFPVRFRVNLPPELVDLKICKAPPQLTNVAEIQRLLQSYYPAHLHHVGGEIMLAMAVDTLGRIWNIEVAEPTANPELEEVALAIGSLMKFRPGTEDGKVVPSLVRIPVSFAPR